MLGLHTNWFLFRSLLIKFISFGAKRAIVNIFHVLHMMDISHLLHLMQIHYNLHCGVDPQQALQDFFLTWCSKYPMLGVFYHWATNMEGPNLELPESTWVAWTFISDPGSHAGEVSQFIPNCSHIAFFLLGLFLKRVLVWLENLFLGICRWGFAGGSWQSHYQWVVCFSSLSWSVWQVMQWVPEWINSRKVPVLSLKKTIHWLLVSGDIVIIFTTVRVGVSVMWRWCLGFILLIVWPSQIFDALVSHHKGLFSAPMFCGLFS